MHEFDDYGFIEEKESLVKIFDTIDLNPKTEAFRRENRSVLKQVEKEEDPTVSITEQCIKLAARNDIHEDVALLLLEQNKWSPDLVQELLTRDKSSTLKAIGISIDKSREDPGFRIVRKNDTCDVCFEDKDLFYCLPCGHCFCEECWRNQITAIVDSGQTRIMCLETGCQCRVPLKSINEFTEPGTYKMLMQHVVDLQVAVNDTMTNCPNPRCAKPLYILGNNHRKRLCNVVKCQHCNFEFCIKCLEMSHAPATCLDVEVWKQLTNEDLMEQRLFGENCKRCPNCHTIIQKNGGCMHMTCWKCKHEFCWLCMKPYDTHPKTFFKCDAYREEDDPYLKKPDDINQEFISQYNDMFLKYQARNKHYRESAKELIEKLTEKIKFNADIDMSQLNEIAKDLIDQLEWAYLNMQYTEVYLFMNRKNQLKENGISIDQQVSTSLKYTTKYLLVKNAFNELSDAVATADGIINSILQKKKIIFDYHKALAQIRIIKLYREQLLKQCDVHYN